MVKIGALLLHGVIHSKPTFLGKLWTSYTTFPPYLWTLWNKYTRCENRLYYYTTGLTVTLKSLQIQTLDLSDFRTGMIGAAHDENSTGSTIPSLVRRCNSSSIFSFIEYGTVLALQNLGVASWSTTSFASKPLRVASYRVPLETLPCTLPEAPVTNYFSSSVSLSNPKQFLSANSSRIEWDRLL